MRIFCHKHSGNIYSITKAYNYIGHPITLFENISDISPNKNDLILISGVGTFDQSLSLYPKDSILNFHENNINILGICSGFQSLFKASEEGQATGYGFFNSNVELLDKSKKTYYGWNQIYSEDEKRVGEFYFTHTYGVNLFNEIDTDVYFSNTFNKKVIAIIKKGNVCGFQFHPEKSGIAGLVALEKHIRSIA